MSEYKEFYNKQYIDIEYAPDLEMEKHPFYEELTIWLQNNPQLTERRFLEIGSGRGALQDIVGEYTGIDYAESVREYYHKDFFVGTAEEMPFEDDAFDAAWSYAVWEHIPDPERALFETIRVLKNGGRFLLRPAWNCRPWAADGYAFRPYSDFGFCGKIYKALIPFMDAKIIRAIKAFVFRSALIVRYYMNRNSFPLVYRKLNANYDHFWGSDSDACNSIDPFSVILWFKAKGCPCVSHDSFIKQFFIGTGPIDVLIRKSLE